MKIASIIGVRPQFVKAAVLSPVIRKEHKEILIHTGQHYDENMSKIFFQQLGLPKPDFVLEMRGAKGDAVLRVMKQLEPVLWKEKPDAVLVYGDTYSTLAGALAAVKYKIPVIHVEAGERNSLNNNPEESIRRKVDQLSSLLLCCSEQALENLRTEGLGVKVRYIGNLMEISFQKNVLKGREPELVQLMQKHNNADCVKPYSMTDKEAVKRSLGQSGFYEDGKFIAIPEKYYMLTCHRQENANEKNLTEILLGMEKVRYPVIYPVHPGNRELVLKIFNKFHLRNIILTEPASYFDSIHLIKNAVAVVTDSGGVLQEAHFAQTPYVFVLDIIYPPQHSRFDVSRLAKPERSDILKKVEQNQTPTRNSDSLDRYEGINLVSFEHNFLEILREFERKI